MLLVGVPTVSCFVGFRVRHWSFRFPFPFRSLVAACAPRIYDEGHSVVPIEAFPIVASPSPAYRAARQGPSKPSKVRSTRTYHRKEGGTRKRSYQRLLPSEAERRHRSVPFPLLGLRNARRNPKGRQGALPLRMPRGFGTERLRTVSGARAFPTPGTYRGSSEGIGREGRQWAFESPTVRSTRAYHRKGGGRRNGTKQYVLRGLFGTTGFVSGVYGMVLRRSVEGSGCVLRSLGA